MIKKYSIILFGLNKSFYKGELNNTINNNLESLLKDFVILYN